VITTTVTGKVKAPDGTVVENAEVVAKLSAYDYDTEFGWIENRKTTTTTDINGDFSFELWPNTRGTEGTNYRVVIRSPKPGVSTNFTATIPEQDTVDLIVASDFDPVPPLSDAEQLVIEAQGYVGEAQLFAAEAEASATLAEGYANDPDIATVAGISSEVTSVSDVSSSVDVVASDLAGAGFDYDLGSITQATEGVVGAPDGYIITLYDIRSDISAVAAIDSDVQIAATNVADITNFADVYLGPASSDPTLRTDGSALQPGDLYFNTTDSDLKVYDGTSWKDASLDTTETRNLFSGGTGVTYNAGTGEFAIGQSVGTTDKVQFEEVDATTVNADFIDCGTIA